MRFGDSFGRWAATAVSSVALTIATLAPADPTIGPEFGIDEPTTCPEEGGHFSPAVAFDGTNYFVVWRHRPGGMAGEENLRGTRVTPAGEILDAWSIPISTGPGEAYDSPVVAFDGSNYLVAWMDSRNLDTTHHDIYAARVSPAGRVLDREGFPVAATAARDEAPTVAGSAAGGFVVAWWRLAPEGNDVLGARVDATGAVLDPDGIAIATDGTCSGPPAAGADGAGWFVAWADNRPGGWSSPSHIHGARVDAAGTVLDPAGIAISSPPEWGAGYVAVAFGGDRYLVAWEDHRDLPASESEIYAARVTSAGMLEDGPPESGGIPVSSGTPRWEWHPAVAYGADSFLVVWQEASTNVLARRVDGTGALLDAAEIPIAVRPSADDMGPAVASDGAGWLVVWYETVGGLIWGARVGAAGEALDPSPFVVSTNSDVERAPAAAFDGTNWLVAWQDWSGAATGRDIHAARVTPAGDILDPVALVISNDYGAEGPPAMAYGGGTSLVAWAGDGTHEGCGICARWVGPDGSTRAWPFSIMVFDAESSEYTFDPAVAFDGTSFLVAWQYCGPSGGRGTCPPGEGRIVGARLSPGVTPTPFTTFDPRLIEVGGSGARGQHAPAVACGAAACLVVWQRWDGVQWDVLGTRVDPAGVVLDPDGISISASAVADETRPDVASDGTGWIVAWEDTRADDGDIYAVRVEPDGEVLDAAGLAVSTAAGAQSAPSVVHDGRRWLVAWRDAGGAGDLRVARVLGSGAVLDPDGVPLSATEAAEAAPALAAGTRGEVLAAYETDSQGGLPRARLRMTTSDCVADAECNDAVACTVDTCVFGTCTNAIAPDACFIDGACRSAGDQDPANMCGSCAPTVSQESWSDDPDGTRCDDEDPCTDDDRCWSGSCSGADIPGCGEDAGSEDAGDDAGGTDEEDAPDGPPADEGDTPGPAVVRLSGGGCGCRVVTAEPVAWCVTLLLASLVVAVGRRAAARFRRTRTGQ